MSWRDQLRGDALSWLLEPEDPGVRYLALRDLLARSPGDPELETARRQAHTQGRIATILAAMHPDGYWVKPGPGYSPKYRSTIWSIMTLAQMGASVALDERLARACAYLLEHSLTPLGQFSYNGPPSGTVDCLHGNLCWALLQLGCDDPRLASAFEWMARSVTGEGVASRDDREAPLRYYAHKCGPGFACGDNAGQPCAWGAVKVMLALGRWPVERRTPLIRRAIEQGVAFLLSTDPAKADYPTRRGDKPNPNWRKFGFPVFYVTDVLQNVEALVALGYGHDPRLSNALTLVRGKQDPQGRWLLETDYAGKLWVDVGPKRQPNKWVTLRALRVLKAAGAWLVPPTSSSAHLFVKTVQERANTSMPDTVPPTTPHLGWRSRGYLPHWDHPGVIQGITFRMADSLPAELRAEWEAILSLADEQIRRSRMQAYLDSGLGSCSLREPAVAMLVEAALLHLDGLRYRLLAWVIMPNHVHVVVQLVEGFTLGSVLQTWKSYTARRINALLGRTGTFWAREYYDRYIRDLKHLEAMISYVHRNPVKAGLVDKPQDWPFSSARRVQAVDTPYHAVRV